MKTWGKSESVGENVREKYLSIQIVFSNFAGCMENKQRVSSSQHIRQHTLCKQRTGPLNPSLRNCNPTRYSEALLFFYFKDRHYF